MQILRSSTSKKDQKSLIFNDLDFAIAIPRRRGAKFYRRLAHSILRTTSLFGLTFASPRSHEIMEK